MTEQEKNSILEQHVGGMKVNSENFSKLLNSKLGDSKPLIGEQSMINETDLNNVLEKLKKLSDDPLLQKIVRSIIKGSTYAPLKAIDVIRAFWNGTIGRDEWGVPITDKERKEFWNLLNPFVTLTQDEIEDLIKRRKEIGEKLKSLLN